MKDLDQDNQQKFNHPELTADGQSRAKVALNNPKTLWFNTGTLCNIECANCYILSSPTNDDLVYITADEVADYLDQLAQREWPVTEIGFTGGEPFMNPHILDMMEDALSRGYEVLVLTNAMRPMMRPSTRDGIAKLHAQFPGKLTFRVSLDHFTAEKHDAERGQRSFEIALEGLKWLRDLGMKTAIAGRVDFAETEIEARQGFADLYEENNFKIKAQSPVETVLFPEMDAGIDVPEITTACWGILNKSPDDIMCASSRMVVKRKGAEKPAVLACTLIAFDERFEMGATLQDAEAAVSLNHPHCSKFCVLGGASCSA